MYNLKDLMEMLKIPERTIRRHLKEGILVGTKVGGTWQFTRDELDHYIRQNKVQEYIKDQGFKDLTDYYRGNIEDKSEVIYMLNKQFNHNTTINNFLGVTKLFKHKYSLNCYRSGHFLRFTFKGQPSDVSILMKWSDDFK